MKNPLRYRFRLRDLNLRDMLAVGIPAAALIAGGFWLAAQFIRPAPPDFLIMSTGAPGGAYQAFAAGYKPILAAQGIELRERPSAGAVENLKRLRDPGEEVDVAFLDPPYDLEIRDRDCYSVDEAGLSAKVREWALKKSGLVCTECPKYCARKMGLRLYQATFFAGDKQRVGHGADRAKPAVQLQCFDIRHRFR